MCIIYIYIYVRTLDKRKIKLANIFFISSGSYFVIGDGSFQGSRMEGGGGVKGYILKKSFLYSSQFQYFLAKSPSLRYSILVFLLSPFHNCWACRGYGCNVVSSR